MTITDWKGYSHGYYRRTGDRIEVTERHNFPKGIDVYSNTECKVTFGYSYEVKGWENVPESVRNSPLWKVLNEL